VNDWEAIRLERDDDGGIRVIDSWPDRVAFSAVLLRTADARYLSLEGDVVRITVANGSASYQLEREPGDPDADPLELVPIPATLVSGIHD
jgi:hypothetical protein